MGWIRHRVTAATAILASALLVMTTVPAVAQPEDLETPGEIRGAAPPPRVKVARQLPPDYQRVDLTHEYKRGSVWVKIQPNRDIADLLSTTSRPAQPPSQRRSCPGWQPYCTLLEN